MQPKSRYQKVDQYQKQDKKAKSNKQKAKNKKMEKERTQEDEFEKFMNTYSKGCQEYKFATPHHQLSTSQN